MSICGRPKCLACGFEPGPSLVTLAHLKATRHLDANASKGLALAANDYRDLAAM